MYSIHQTPAVQARPEVQHPRWMRHRKFCTYTGTQFSYSILSEFAVKRKGGEFAEQIQLHMRCIGDTEGAFAFDDSDNATALVESATLMVFIIFASASPNPWISHEPEGHTAGIRKHEDSEAFPVTAPHLLICMYCTDLISAVEMCFTSWSSSLWSGFFSHFFLLDQTRFISN